MWSVYLNVHVGTLSLEGPHVEGENIVIVTSLTEIMLTGCLGVELIIVAEGPIEFWEECNGD